MLFSSVLPLLVDQLELSDILVTALPSLITLVDVTTQDDYVTHLQPIMQRLYRSPLPVQVSSQNSQLLFIIHFYKT